jgi:WW domain-containing oxidoreductase
LSKAIIPKKNQIIHMTDKDSKVVLITGASDGLGLAAALKYAQANFSVVMAGRSQEKLQKAGELVQKAVPGEQTRKVHTLCFDFSSLQSVRKGAADFLALDLPLHILINNAGITATKYEFTQDTKVFEKTIMINMVGPLLFTELLLPRMQTSGGRILIVSSNLHNPAEKRIGQKQQDPSRLILPLDNLDGSKSWDATNSYAVGI